MKLDVNWRDLMCQLDQNGYALTEQPVLDASQCEQLVHMYDEPTHWRSRIDMARHRFGSGEYQYFSYPLPDSVDRLRSAFYPQLATLANAWNERLGLEPRFPAQLQVFLDRCHAAGQTRPTPLVLRYKQGDYNCLHQDIYGALAFPFQLMVMLAASNEYDGGEFLLVENQPRAQSRGTALTLQQGQAIVWPTRMRPASGARGFFKIGIRHGVSAVRRGRRHTLGVIFHDAA